ncbi:Bax inhibitor-1 family protein [soil metagenome]
MDYSLDYSSQRIAAEASADARATFIRKTYGHLAGAILAFAIIETLLVQLTPPDVIRDVFFNRVGMIALMIGFVGVAWVANSWAMSGASRGKQYAGLALYVVAEAVIFLPLMFIAANFAPDILPKAGIMTLAMFAGLTVACFVTKTDFSFLRSILVVGGFLALGFVVVAMVMGMDVGNWYSFAMVALASGYILYDTSNVMYRYRTDQYVAASLALFASVALLFYYIVRIFLMSRRN